MQRSFLCVLQKHRPTLCMRWKRLLRAERVSSPMANPDLLVYLMDWTLDRLYEELRHPMRRLHHNDPNESAASAACECGMNPLLTYFATAEQAILETLLIVDGAWNREDALRRSADLEKIKRAFHAVARHEIALFCAVCQRRKHGEHTRTSA